MSTVNPYGYPADVMWGAWQTTEQSRCPQCGTAELDGASYVVSSSGACDWQCRACTTAEMDQRELNLLIDRLNRNPELAAKVRKALGVE